MGRQPSYLVELYDSFKRTNGFVTAFLSLILSFITWSYSPDGKVPLFIAVLVLFVLLIINFAFVDASIKLYRLSRSQLPKIHAARSLPNFVNGLGLLILEPSELFSTETIVSIYKKQNDIETLLAIGYVLTVQENGLIQIVVTKSAAENSTLASDLQSGNAEFCRELLVKPHVPKVFLGEYKL